MKFETGYLNAETFVCDGCPIARDCTSKMLEGRLFVRHEGQATNRELQQFAETGPADKVSFVDQTGNVGAERLVRPGTAVEIAERFTDCWGPQRYKILKILPGVVCPGLES